MTFYGSHTSVLLKLFHQFPDLTGQTGKRK